MARLEELEGLAEANPEVIILKAGGADVAAGGSSTQGSIDPDLGTPNEAITPPESLEQLQSLTGESATRGPIIDAIALNTVGLGYSIVPAKGRQATVGEDLSAAAAKIEDELERLARRDTRLEHPSLSELLVAVKNDEEGCGNAYIEVSRDQRTGRISGLFHVPGHRVRRLKGRNGYVLAPPTGDWSAGDRFYNFGEKVLYDANGKPRNKLANGKRWERNELIAFKLYTSESRDYGLPRDAAIIADVFGDKLAAESNLGFFDSSGVAPTIIFVQGEETRAGNKTTFKVPDDTVRRIADTLKPEPGRASRVAIIPVPPGTKTDKHDLAQRSERDIGYTEFRADNRQRHLTAFRMQPLLVAVSDSGRYDAEVQRAMTLEQVFDPEQRRYEDRLRYTLLTDLGYGDWTIKFKRMAVEGDVVRREATERGAEVGVVTNGEFREAHGEAPLPEANESDTPIEWRGEEWQSEKPKPGQVPFGWNSSLINPQLIGSMPGALKGAPAGAENRVNAGADQRGLRPGIGGRTSRDKSTGQPRHVEAAVQQLNGSLSDTSRASVTRALARAGRSSAS